MVNKKEYRIQAGYNARSCLESAITMLAKDYFLNGTTSIPIFACDISVTNDSLGNVSIGVKTKFMGVNGEEKAVLFVDDKGDITIL